MSSAYELLGVDPSNPVHVGALRDFTALADLLAFLVDQRQLRYPQVQATGLERAIIDEVERIGGNPGVRSLQLYARMLGFELQLSPVPVQGVPEVDVEHSAPARFMLGTIEKLAALQDPTTPTVKQVVDSAERVYPAGLVRETYWALQAAGLITTSTGGIVSRIPRPIKVGFQTRYGVRTILRHANGHETIEPLRLSLEDWQALAAAGVRPELELGYTAGEAAQVVRLALPLARRANAAFLAVPGADLRLLAHVVEV